jgi:hypothetical protein
MPLKQCGFNDFPTSQHLFIAVTTVHTQHHSHILFGTLPPVAGLAFQCQHSI